MARKLPSASQVPVPTNPDPRLTPLFHLLEVLRLMRPRTECYCESPPPPPDLDDRFVFDERIASLASSLASFVSGHTLEVTGGAGI